MPSQGPQLVAEPDSGLLTGLFSPGVEARSGAIRGSWHELPPGEATFIAGAVEARQREFATGRGLARRALTAMGVASPDPIELLPDADRVPLWPSGIVGTISHKRSSERDLCAVALAWARDFRGLGLDVEPAEPIRTDLQRSICTDRERERLAPLDSETQGVHSRMLFSAKEAVYKAFFPILRERWGFRQVEIELDPECERFRARVPERAGSDRVEGRIVRRRGWLIAAVELARCGPEVERLRRHGS